MASLTPTTANDHQTSAATAAITIPTNWSRGEMLGVGELYSKVFLCHHDQQNGRQLAVKEIISTDPNDSQNLEKRIEPLKALQHNHIVQYYGTERSDSSISVFMEYMPGGSVYQHLRQHGPLDEQLSRKYTRQLLEGIEYLHYKGIFHGRIKCSNLLIDNSGNIKVIDYGVSKQLHAIEISNNKCGAYTVVNSYPLWRAPELIAPDSMTQGSVDNFKCDVWSIGCTVMEMLTGHPPYHDLTPFAGLWKIVNEPMAFDFSSHSNADCIHSFLHCCFSRDIASRPTVAELLKHEYVNVSAAGDGTDSMESSEHQ